MVGCMNTQPPKMSVAIDAARPPSEAAPPAGDAFEAALIAQREAIERVVRRLLGWSGDADDVVQEVFVRALRAKSSFRGEARLSTWLTRIAVHACRSHLRWRRLRRWVGLAGVDELPGRSPTGGEEGRERFEAVRAAIVGLSARHREVAVLHWLEGLSPSEIAEILGERRNTIEVRLSRARAELRERLAGWLE